MRGGVPGLETSHFEAEFLELLSKLCGWRVASSTCRDLGIQPHVDAAPKKCSCCEHHAGSTEDPTVHRSDTI